MSRRIDEDGHGRKEREDEGLHEKLRSGLTGGRIQLFTDPRMIDFDGSPVHCHWDHLLPLTGLMTLALGILLAGGIVVGIIAMTLFVMVYLLGNRYYVAWRLRTRTVEYLCCDVAHVQALWRLGGIALVVPGTGEAPCVAPKGDWRKFIRRHFGESVQPPEPMVNAPVPVVPPIFVSEPEPETEIAPPPPPIFTPEPEIEPPPPPPPPPVQPAPVIEMAPPRTAPPRAAPPMAVPPLTDVIEPEVVVSPQPGDRWDSILDEEKLPRDEVLP
ncbi:hypothetical protein [Magnetospirillum molischianum]|uniref:Uncharacterized protein n=1 Tax=Magnetospirillum molischianum DSM 120 TaxID=1150626 RepID=H8FT02_MAGML|nr:hypothetical protein [Magnetospirillum molischianum]CCG41490.1 conserved hypothetical protein [Magnetospirillum molischianum DSM 120]